MSRPFVIAEAGQSVWDLALGLYGAAEGAAQLIIDNPDVCNFDESPLPGSAIYYDPSKVINKDVVRAIAERGLRVVTGALEKEVFDDALLVDDDTLFSIGDDYLGY